MQPCTLIRLLRSERGITGLETAIVLIAFVVVAAVFSFVVLSTGLFSSERGKETVYAGLAKTRGTMGLSGSIIGTSNGTELTALSFSVTLAAGGEEVSLDPTATNNRTVMSYHDDSVIESDLVYVTTVAVGDADSILEPGELLTITIDLTQSAAIDIRDNETFWIEMKPPTGSYLVIQRTLPPSITQTIVNLN